MDFFDSVEMIDDNPLEDHKIGGDELSQASSMSDVSELAQPHLMSGSFVQLKHPSNAKDISTKAEDNEIQDADRFEGRNANIR